eukprot:m.145903 g.145903  ORF g.145903 m.145903 type:complete len:783 (+) comp17748_c0_seq1:96-2444(+)
MACCPKWLVLADDLTGACDTAQEFFSAGASAEVLIDLSRGFNGGSDVIACSSDSRNSSATEAADAVVNVAEKILKHVPQKSTGQPTTFWTYKKVDSTIRGQISAEIKATLDMFGQTMVVLAPAFPSTGRTTVGGYQLLHGNPVEDSQMNCDDLAPVLQSHVPSLFCKEDSIIVSLLSLSDVRTGSDHVQEFLRNAHEAAKTAAKRAIVVCDTASDTDLSCIAIASMALALAGTACPHSSILFSGAGAFAYALAKASGEHWSMPAGNSDVDVAQVGGGAILVASASQQSVTDQQIKKLQQEFASATENDASAHALWDAETIQTTMATYTFKDTLLYSVTGKNNRNTFQTVARAITNILKTVRTSGVFLTGGELAATVLQDLHATALIITGSVETGVAKCKVIGGDIAGSQVVTKGGAMGTENSMVDGVKAMRDAVYLGVAKPILGVTMGDPCGVGPEIIAKALADASLYKKYRPVVIGDPTFLTRGVQDVKGSLVARRVTSIGDCKFEYGTVECYSPFDIAYDEVKVGVVCAEAGRCAAQWVIEAVKLACSDTIDAIVTAPLNKEAMQLGGFKFNGHTELLAKFSGAKTSRLMLVANNLKVVHATCHVAFRKVHEQLAEPGRLETTIELFHAFLKGLGYSRPRIALAGLNPHCGDGDIYGVTEETTIIAPCAERFQAKGYCVIGPVPGDTCFMRAVRGDFDGVVAMYHDEGHIPAKLMGFGDTVNVTLGLPIIRTSVDHGTAFDISGQGIAHESNLMTAIRMGGDMAVGRLWAKHQATANGTV